MPFNYQQDFRNIQLDPRVIEGASKSPFSIAGKAMDDLNTSIDNRIFSKDIAKVNSLEDLLTMTPRTKEQQAMFTQRQGSLSAIADQKHRENMFKMAEEDAARKQYLFDLQNQQRGQASEVLSGIASASHEDNMGRRFNLNELRDAQLAYADNPTIFNALQKQIDPLEAMGLQTLKNTAKSSTGGVKADKIFKTATREEAIAHGYDPSKQWQYNLAGEWKEKGVSGEWVEEQKIKAMKASVPLVSEGLNRLDKVNKLFDDSWAATGVSGAIASYIPGTSRATMEAELKTIASQDTFNALMALKNASENGASGLGQVTEREIELLMQQAGGIDFGANAETIKANLEKVTNRYHNIMQKLVTNSALKGQFSKEQIEFYKDRKMSHVGGDAWKKKSSGLKTYNDGNKTFIDPSQLNFN